MSSLNDNFSEALRAIEARGQHRSLRSTEMKPQGRLQLEGRNCLDFSSNDYLNLSQHPLLIERASEWSKKLGAGAGASRLVTGTREAHLALEARIAAFKGTEAALLFATGWQANAAVVPALLAAAPGAAVFTDRLIHASLHHGCAAAGAKQHRFRHNDLDHLEELLANKGADSPARIIITESVFSMDGDMADLARLVDIAQRLDAFLYLDEAHATGVVGPGGAGLSAGFPGSVDLVMGTFSKALGCFGAYVAGSRLLCDYLVNTCSSFIFSTAPPPAVLGAIDAAFELVPLMDRKRAHLGELGDTLRRGLSTLGVDSLNSTTHIVPAIVGDAGEAVRLSEALADRNIVASAIRPPTVPPGTSRLRLALRATHSHDDIDMLVAAIRASR
ncbi:MAG: 8-amino-7-oxononanoate synthase [Novosphingobium sp.]|nr:8-amino-7-oxononanoate synthase [Novosphingobium sp.]